MSGVVTGAAPSAAERRAALRAALAAPAILRMPGAFSPLVAMAVEDAGFGGVYVSGAALSADLGLPDIGLTTMTEVAARAGAIAAATALPVLVDADTGFGEPMNAARTIRALEDAGVAGCHLEDQVTPKRCGHLDGKELVPAGEMARRIRAAVEARRDPGFVICARTDARAVEGLDAAIARARAYVAAGADMVFPEAMESLDELAAVRAALDVPLLANMTEFGRTPLLTAEALEGAGIDAVIYPVTTLRLAMGAVEDGLRTLLAEGTQAGLVERMQTRARLYELIDYPSYAARDARVAGYAVTGGTA